MYTNERSCGDPLQPLLADIFVYTLTAENKRGCNGSYLRLVNRTVLHVTHKGPSDSLKTNSMTRFSASGSSLSKRIHLGVTRTAYSSMIVCSREDTYKASYSVGSRGVSNARTYRFL